MLWSNDLPEEEARALRQRIATEPEVAEAWRRLNVAMDALAELPAELPAPALRREPVKARRSLASAVPWALAAAAVLALAIPRAEPDLVLASGGQWVEGDVHLLAADTRIDVDGKVWVTVEPATGDARVEGPEDPMNRSTWLAGLAGAVVTVVVYEGTAVVHADPGNPGVTVAAGESHRVGAPAPASETPLSEAERLANIARLEEELQTVQRALAEAKFEGALTRGQLVAMQGNPSEWPKDVPPEIGPERFAAELAARLEGVEDVEIAEVDCTEYPCIAALEYTGDDPDGEWEKPMGEAVRGWLETAIPNSLSLSVNTSRFRNGDQQAQYLIFAGHDAEAGPDVGTRTEYRMDALVDDLGQQVKAP